MGWVKLLGNELLTLTKSVPAFANNGFSVFDIDDLAEKNKLGAFPIIGVAYDGAQPVDGNAANPASFSTNAAVIVELQFVVLIGLQYNYAGQDDTKPQAYDLLDDVRAKVLGYKGVNRRPWRFHGERPELVQSEDGLLFYSQFWRTAVPSIGTSINQES